MNVDTASLESMCELIVDCPHSTPKWTDSGVVVLRNQNIRNGQLELSSPSYTNEAGYQSRVKRAIPQVGDIIFTREAPMGEVCLIPSGLKCCLGQRQVLLRPKETVNGEYLYWALQSPFVQHQISWNEGTGTTVSNVRIPVLKSLQIPRRGSDEQKIADALSSLAHKIRLNHQINQTLEQMAQAIFKSWFVDFEPVKAKIAALEAGGSEEDALLAAMQAISGTALFDAYASAASAAEQLARLQAERPERYAELRATAELFPSAMQDSELGKIPEGWISPNFEDLATAKQGKYLSKDKMITVSSDVCGVPVWGGNGILGYAEKPSYFDPIVLMTCRGSNCGLIRHTESASWVSNNAFACTPKVGSIWFLLVYFYASSFDDCISGSAQPQITYSALRTKKLSFPFQQQICGRYSEIIQPLFDQILHLRGEIMSLEDIRDALLPKLFSGQLSVSTAETDLTEVEKPAHV
jgi:type I restriction enzyme S subunit